jgi:hypothetical protein
MIFRWTNLPLVCGKAQVISILWGPAGQSDIKEAAGAKQHGDVVVFSQRNSK